jgi:hypothetical protein
MLLMAAKKWPPDKSQAGNWRLHWGEESGLIQNVVDRIYDGIIHGHLIVEMGSRGKLPRASNKAYKIASMNFVPIFHIDFRQMPIRGLNSIAMVNSDKFAHPTIIGSHDYFS